MAANYTKYADKFSDSTSELVNSETFLNLLVAEMTNQDPLEPSTNTEFITQMAQFSQLQYAQETSEYSMANYASSLVGKVATASKSDGSTQVTKTGVVTDVMKNGDDYTVTIDGVSFDLSKVTKVSENTDTTSSSTSYISTGTELGDSISRASMMIGMSATVATTTDSGTVYDSGIIDSIQIKDGVISAVINDIAYDLSDIVEVAYPTYSVDDSSSADDTAVDTTGDVTEDVTEVVDGTSVDEDIDEVTGEVITEEEEDDLEDLVDLEDIASDGEEV
jgi:flagellar basal-body rod modification protein FlgD